MRVFGYLLFCIFTFFFTSCIQKDVNSLASEYSLDDSSIPVKWSKYVTLPAPWSEVKCVGDLKDVLSKGYRADLPIAGDSLNRLPIDVIAPASSEAEEEDLISRLAAINTLLKHGASPQRMTENSATSEYEYALFLKYGLNPKKPVQYGAREIQYPLTRRSDYITYPIAKYLLENGADPNQLEIKNREDQPDNELLTPLSKVTFRLPPFLHEAELYHKYRSKEQVAELQELLKSYGAVK